MSSTITDRLAGLSTSVAVKAPVRVATTTNITLSGLQTIDTITVVEGDRVLVKDQTSSSQNGIYYASALGWDRTEDLDSGDDIVDGTTIYVRQGAAGGSNWFQAAVASTPAVIGTTAITWAITYVALGAATAATETSSGIAEIATQTETNTGTDDQRFVTPLKLKNYVPYDICIPVTTETGAVASGTAKVTFRMVRAMTVTGVVASLKTAQSTGSILTIDINENGTSIISTKLTIDNTEKTSTTALTPAVISDASLANDSEITIDIDQIGDGTAVGLKVYLVGHLA